MNRDHLKAADWIRRKMADDEDVRSVVALLCEARGLADWSELLKDEDTALRLYEGLKGLDDADEAFEAYDKRMHDAERIPLENR